MMNLYSWEVMELSKTGKIYGINGPVIYLKGNTGFGMSEMVYVGRDHLVGEVIALDKDRTTIQVYEETSGLRPGEEVTASGNAVSVTLAPGILNNIFDGIERPLEKISETGGAFITKGISVDSLDREKKWDTHFTVKKGDYVNGGDIFAEVPETRAIVHKCMIPPHLHGTVVSVREDGPYTIEEPLLTLDTGNGQTVELPMAQKWPIRTPRPVSQRFAASVPLVTGQRIIDTMFPIAKGGTAAIPGGFGTGKTMTQHQIAKWSDADIIIYIGCGERGNEMTQVLEEFGELTDPRTGNPLMDRTCRWRPVRQVSIRDLLWPSITGTWDMMWRSWRTPHRDGRRLFVNFPDVWRRCRQKKDSRLTLHPGCRLSMRERA